MSEWITDRTPTNKDILDGLVISWNQKLNQAQIVYHRCVVEGRPWMPIAPPEPYVKPKRWSVAESKKIGFIVYDSTKVTKVVADSIPTREAAERIAAIYEEVMP